MLTIKQCLPLLALLAHHVGAGEAREGEAGQPEAVPVIHLTEDQYTGKASVDDYLKMFPNELLASNKRVKPIDIRKIEHEDFIDYEIEFIELPALEEKSTGTDELLLKTESSNSITSKNEIQNGSLHTENSANKSEKSKELNLVNFVDLLRKTKARAKPSRSRAGGDRRRRRRIKLKRDPGRSGPSRASLREINGFSNQINTEQSKRDQNNLSSETHVFSKPRTIIRNLIQLPETVRKSSLLDRRTTISRLSNFRARKRVPLKSGRSFYRDDKPSDQLIRLRNPEIITKLERSTFKERNVIRTQARSEDDLDDKMTVPHVPGSLPGSEEEEEDEGESEVREFPGEAGMTGAPLQITTSRSAGPETTIPSIMMYPVQPVQPVQPVEYPEVFTSRPQDIPVTELPAAPSSTSSSPSTVSLPAISLISVFGPGHPRSSRLQIVPAVAPALTTVSSLSPLRFSIISTSTQTSGPVVEHTTPAVDRLAQTEELQPVLRSEQTKQTLSETKTADTKSTSISLPITTTTRVGPGKEVVATTSSEDLMKIPVTDMTDGSPATTTQQIQEDESKFQEVTTARDPGSIMTDSQMTTSSVADDLLLSESITSVYIHNSSVIPSAQKNIKTSEIPNKETTVNPVISIKILAESKTTDETTLPPTVTTTTTTTITTTQPDGENIFTVTPQYVRTSPRPTTPTTTTPYPDGQYLETNPGPYHHDPVGDQAPPYVHDHRANYQHDSTGDTAPPYHHDPSGDLDEDGYSNLDTNYPGDYEVNEVKVDFDNQDEHKIYNVQAKAGDFIIGEVGRIDINNGQTVEGVRYTALQGEVDPLRIREILNRFFGARTS